MRDAGLELELVIAQDLCLTRLPSCWGAWSGVAGSVSSRSSRFWRRRRRREPICRRSRAGSSWCLPRCTQVAPLGLSLPHRRAAPFAAMAHILPIDDGSIASRTAACAKIRERFPELLGRNPSLRSFGDRRPASDPRMRNFSRNRQADQLRPGKPGAKSEQNHRKLGCRITISSGRSRISIKARFCSRF